MPQKNVIFYSVYFIMYFGLAWGFYIVAPTYSCEAHFIVIYFTFHVLAHLNDPTQFFKELF